MNLVQKYGKEFQFAFGLILLGGRHDYTEIPVRMHGTSNCTFSNQTQSNLIKFNQMIEFDCRTQCKKIGMTKNLANQTHFSLFIFFHLC